MRTVGTIFGGIAALVLLLSLCFGLTWMGIEWRGFFGPKRAAVERKIFKETRSFNEGMIQQLARYHSQYLLAKEPSDKAAIKGVVRQMFADYDYTKITNPNLRNFYLECTR